MRSEFDTPVIPGLSATITAPSSQDTRAAKSLVVTPSGGSGTYTFAWTWVSRPTGAAATFSNTAIANPSITPDAEGVWSARCVVSDGSLTVTVYTSITVGVETAPGVFARVLFDLDLVAIGTSSTIDLLASGDADYTIGGVRFRCSTDAGVPSTFAVDANGLHVVTAGLYSAWAIAYLVADYGVAAGDTVFMQAVFGSSTMGANLSFVQVSVGDDNDAPIASEASVGIGFIKASADSQMDLQHWYGTGSSSKLSDVGGSSPPAAWAGTVRACNYESSTYYNASSSIQDPKTATEVGAERQSATSSAQAIASGRYLSSSMNYGGIKARIDGNYTVKRIRCLLVRPESP